MENLIIKLKKFKEIQPDWEYSQHSKRVILAAPLIEKLKIFRGIVPDVVFSRNCRLAILSQPEKIFVWNWRLSLAVASLLVVLITGGWFNYSRPVLVATNLNTQALEGDLQNLNINIQLAKIEYYQQSKETVSLALQEISENQADHLDSSILESEKNQLKENSASPGENIDDLLNQILL